VPDLVRRRREEIEKYQRYCRADTKKGRMVGLI
jgi:hypothetical protein